MVTRPSETCWTSTKQRRVCAHLRSIALRLYAATTQTKTQSMEENNNKIITIKWWLVPIAVSVRASLLPEVLKNRSKVDTLRSRMVRWLALRADASETDLCRSVGCTRTPEPAAGHAETNAHRLPRRSRALIRGRWRTRCTATTWSGIHMVAVCVFLCFSCLNVQLVFNLTCMSESKCIMVTCLSVKSSGTKVTTP